LKSSTPYAIVAIVAVALLVAFSAFSVGYKAASEAEAKRAHSKDARHQKMLDFIVKRNPQATIRDFASLPEVILQVSEKHGIDYRLVMAMIDKESQFRPDAVGGSGEIGLMQILPQTAALIAKRKGIEFVPPKRGTAKTYSDLGSLGDPATNVEFGVQYLAWQVEEFGVSPTALRAYNRAPQNARDNRPSDRYAEEVSMKYVVIAASLPR